MKVKCEDRDCNVAFCLHYTDHDTKDCGKDGKTNVRNRKALGYTCGACLNVKNERKEKLKKIQNENILCI